MRNLIWISCALLLLACAGCKEGGPATSGYLAKTQEGRVRLVVLPFESAGLQSENAGQIVSQEMVTALLATGMFDVADPGAVYQAMVDAGLRNGNGYGLGPAAMDKLQEKLGPVRVFLVGIVQEFGEVRVGPASYPSISINARLLDGQTGAILWSGSVSRTGADTEKFFGLGAVHSTGRLARIAVRDLVGSVNRRELAKILQASPGAAPSAAQAHALPTSSLRRTGTERYFDENASYPEAALRGLLVDIAGMTRSAVDYREHHYSIVEASYQTQNTTIGIKLIDYRKASAAKDFVKLDHPDEAEGTFEGLPAYAAPSPAQRPGGYHLDVAVGRFGLYAQGPSERKTEIETVARALIDAMQ